MKASKLVITLGICLCYSWIYPTKAEAIDDEFINPNWIKPDPWSRYDREQLQKQVNRREECQCPPVPKCDPNDICPHAPVPVQTINPPDDDNRLAIVFYKKFVTWLIDDRQLVQDDGSEYLLRNIQFKVSSKQVKDLKRAKTARDIDGIVSGIVEQSEGSMYLPSVESFCWSITTFLSTIGQNVYLMYFLIPTICLPAVYFLVKILSRVMHVHPLIVVILLFITVSFAITLDECNQKLEMESLAKLMQRGTSNPCEMQHNADRGLYGWMENLFGESSEAKCIKHLRETLGASRKTCDPSHVFLEMVAKLQLRYFETFVQKMIDIFKASTASSGIVESVLITVFFILIIYILVTNGLKYGIYGAFNFLGVFLTTPRGNSPPMNQNALPEGQHSQQSIAGTIPTSFNFKINIDRGRKKPSRADINRIEEIADNSKPKPETILQGPKESPKNIDDGSGDATKPNETSESESDEGEQQIVLSFPHSTEK
ncbi:uncharacterized protein LOC131694923 [Topomyia yanbarensis]|uniref:uncharacterized protein LOC131694923 n=1 Tax=Topomyia yanbarensis TaxID=2498891 RepID=UPI00273CADFC|nr:uncharacterized protein LOC131694923 [Topomyia yanbarensis]